MKTLKSFFKKNLDSIFVAGALYALMIPLMAAYGSISVYKSIPLGIVGGFILLMILAYWDAISKFTVGFMSSIWNARYYLILCFFAGVAIRFFTLPRWWIIPSVAIVAIIAEYSKRKEIEVQAYFSSFFEENKEKSEETSLSNQEFEVLELKDIKTSLEDRKRYLLRAINDSEKRLESATETYPSLNKTEKGDDLVDTVVKEVGKKCFEDISGLRKAIKEADEEIDGINKKLAEIEVYPHEYLTDYLEKGGMEYLFANID